MAKTMNKYNEVSLESKINDMSKEIKILEEYSWVRAKIIEKMQWDYMNWKDPDDDHEEKWFDAPDEDDYRYQGYEAINELLSKLDKAIIGG